MIKAWLFSRHGARYPSQKILNKINNQLVPEIQNLLKQIYDISEDGRLLKYDNQLEHNQRKILQGLLQWKNPLAKAFPKSLNQFGQNFMIEFGRRMKAELKPLSETLIADEIEVLYCNCTVVVFNLFSYNLILRFTGYSSKRYEMLHKWKTIF